MPTYVEDFLTRPVGFLGTVFCNPWSFEKRFALIGDAAHAITPFFGQVYLKFEYVDTYF
jgi:kynurenine 3-monooxygenase